MGTVSSRQGILEVPRSQLISFSETDRWAVEFCGASALD
jgi:hypothetical protein